VKRRVVVAVSSFKNCAAPWETTAWVAEGLELALPPAYSIERVPTCDGGTGFCGTITRARGGVVKNDYSALGPLGRPLERRSIGWFRDLDGARVAVLEAADTTGLALVEEARARGTAMDTSLLRRTSYGLGQMLRAAREGGADRILVGLGDSAVQDCGLGALQALGARIYLRGCRTPLEEPAAAEHLPRVERIDPDPIGPYPPIELACNLSTRLLGPGGTVEHYAQQKGGDYQTNKTLRKGTELIAKIYERTFGCPVARMLGAGSNGGVAAALIAALGARPRYSFRVVAEHTRLLERLRGAAAVVVGEGRMDESTTRGKAPGATALLASALEIPVFAVAGTVAPRIAGRLASLGIIAVQTLSFPQLSEEEYIRRTPMLLRDAGVRLAPTIMAISE
jgi:glycerate kinase